AFTTTFSAKHLPSFIAHQAHFSSKGVASIICLSVNDAIVMKSWGEHQGSHGITILADGDASFTKSIGLDKDTAGLGGIRS
ncbi:redoxin family protein, partial [Pseudoalteromonas ruthenica]|uniref:redoxin family protein n=1 Tax=Pseudoalteromonas ruthenica TaxID=151081 RepID=UPI001276AF9F